MYKVSREGLSRAYGRYGVQTAPLAFLFFMQTTAGFGERPGKGCITINILQI